VSSLLLLKALMTKIGEVERAQEDPAFHSAHPIPKMQATATALQETDGSQATRSISADYYPCHYFDFIAGTSTGG
jgi:hypothetical protein